MFICARSTGYSTFSILQGLNSSKKLLQFLARNANARRLDKPRQLEDIMKLDLLSAATTSLVLAVATLTACATRTNYVDLYGMPAPT
jgi:hypothetical protein